VSFLRRRRPPVATRRVGRYLLQAETGRDPTGVLWRGNDTLLPREVVIKEITVAERLPPKQRDAFDRRLQWEWLAVARIGHPGAATPFDIVREQDRTFIVTERIDAPTLAELVEQHRPCAPAEAAAIGRQLLDVLQAAHRKGIVHGDVRPENVLVLRDGRVKLTQFGIAAPTEGLEATELPRSPFAPTNEVVEAGGPQGDLWSLGVTLYWSVAREPRFDHASRRAGGSPRLNHAEAKALVLDQRRPRRLPPSATTFDGAGPLVPVLEALLIGSPHQCPSAAELGEQLDEIAGGHRHADEATDQRDVLSAPPADEAQPTPPAHPQAAAVSASTRALLALVAEGFASRLAFGLIGFALPLYARSLGLSLAAIGVLASLNSVVALVLKPAMGAVADRYGRKRTLGIAMAVRSILALLYGLATTPLALYGVRAGHGLADSMRDPSVTALIADNGGKKAVASAFAWYQTAKTVAGSVGKSVAGVLLAASAGSYATVFAAAFVLSALPLLVVAVFVRESDTSQDEDEDEVVQPAPPAQPPPPAPRTRPYVVLGFLVSGAASMLGTLFPILATEYAGLSPAQAGALYLITPALALSGPLFGWLADHVSSRLVLSLRSAANVGSSLLYLLVPTIPGFLAGKALDDLGKAAFKPAWGAIMTEISSFDRSRRARTMSWMSVGEDAGDLAAPVVAGLLWTLWGAPAVLLARAGLAVTAEVWALWIAGPGARRNLPTPGDEHDVRVQGRQHGRPEADMASSGRGERIGNNAN
jgi:MFS family permease